MTYNKYNWVTGEVITQEKLNHIEDGIGDSLDVDISNISNLGKSNLSGLGMPSDRYINLTLGASGTTYTAPANGYFSICSRSANTVRFDGLKYSVTMPNVNGSISSVIFPILKGKTTTLIYETLDLSNSWNYFRFIYAEGEQ